MDDKLSPLYWYYSYESFKGDTIVKELEDLYQRRFNFFLINTQNFILLQLVITRN